MKVLRYPLVSEDMNVSASLTGIMLLKSGKYHSRINSTREIMHHPGKGIILKSSNNEHRPAWSVRKKKFQKSKTTSPAVVSIPKKLRYYSIEKSIVTHRIHNFINQMAGKKRLYFWTVTFPLRTSDDTAFLLLNKWLTRLRKEGLLTTYLWVTERQENGTIHFHIAINHYLDVRKANRYMRACIMTCISNEEINYTHEQAKNYNGIDISKDRKTRRITNFALAKKQRALTSYLTKYLTKNNGSFTHLAWHCSRDYSNLITHIHFTYKEFFNSKESNLVATKPTFETEWIFFYKWCNSPPTSLTQYLSNVNQYALSLISKN